MSDWTDNLFYPSAERIWLCIRLTNAGLRGPAIDLQKIPILAKKIFFSDEAHFDLGGYANKQNCLIWAIENPTYCLVQILIQRHNWGIFLRK